MVDVVDGGPWLLMMLNIFLFLLATFHIIFCKNFCSNILSILNWFVLLNFKNSLCILGISSLVSMSTFIAYIFTVMLWSMIHLN